MNAQPGVRLKPTTPPPLPPITRTHTHFRLKCARLNNDAAVEQRQSRARILPPPPPLSAPRAFALHSRYSRDVNRLSCDAFYSSIYILYARASRHARSVLLLGYATPASQCTHIYLVTPKGLIIFFIFFIFFVKSF